MKELRRALRSRVFFALVAVCALAFLPPALAVLFGAWPFDGDALAAFGPWHQFAAQSLRDGVLPLWNPHLYCGTPFMANGQSGVLYPPNVIYLFLPVRAALLADALLHDILLACGGYCLARALRLERLSGFVVAVCLAEGGAVSAHLYAGHLTWNAARAYTPWELWALLMYLRSGRTKYLWALAPMVALQLAAGSPPVSVLAIELCLGLLFAWVVTFWCRGRAGRVVPLLAKEGLGVVRPQLTTNSDVNAEHISSQTPAILIRSGLPHGWWWHLPACAGLAGLLAGAIALPVLEFSRLSVHGAGMRYDDVVALSGSWRSLVRLLSPDFFGGNGTAPQWSVPFSPHEEVAYIGVLGLLLALAAPWIASRSAECIATNNLEDKTGELARVSPPCEGGEKGVVRPYPIDQPTLPIQQNLQGFGKNKSLPSAIPWLWALLPISALLAMGGHTPLYRPLFDHFAVFRMTRVPVRWLEVWYFAATLLAGFSFDACFVRRRESGDADRRVRLLAIALCVVAAVAIVTAIAAFALPSTSHPWQSAVQLFHANDSAAERASMADRFRAKAATAAFTAGIIALLAASMAGQWISALTACERRRIELKMAGLIALDLLFASISSMLIVSGADYTKHLQWPAEIVKHFKPGDRWDTQVEDEREMDQGMPLGIDLYNGYDPMNSSRYFQFVEAMEPTRSWGGVYQPWDRTPLLLVTGTDYTIVAPHLDGTPTTPPAGDIHSVQVVAANGWQLWQSSEWGPRAWPRAYLTRRVIEVPEQRQLAALDLIAGIHSFVEFSGNIDYHLGKEPASAALKLSPSERKRLFKLAVDSPQRRIGAPTTGLSVVVAPGTLAVSGAPIHRDETVTSSPLSVNQIRMQSQADAVSAVVLAESWFPGWQAWVNGQPEPIVPANFLFRAVQVPAGPSNIDWVYNSSTFRFGLFLSLAGVSLLCGIGWTLRGNP